MPLCLEQDNLDDIPNYVVIGAFSKQANAIRFTDRAQKALKLDAKFEMNPKRNLYYVYVLNTEDLSLAVQEAQAIKGRSLNSGIHGSTGDLLPIILVRMDRSLYPWILILPPEVKEEVKVVESTPEVKVDSAATHRELSTLHRKHPKFQRLHFLLRTMDQKVPDSYLKFPAVGHETDTR